MKISYRVLVALTLAMALLVIWFSVQYAISSGMLDEKFSQLLIFFPAAFGAMCGAIAAFFFNLTIEQHKKEKLLADDLRHTIFLIAAKLNQLRGVKKDMLDKYESSSARWGAMHAYMDILEKPRLDISTLSFLHEEEPKFLLELDIYDDCYFLSVRAFNDRSKLHRERLQPEQSKILQTHPEIGHTYQQTEEYMDYALVETMKVATEGCYQIIPLTIEQLHAAQKKLMDIATKRFPKEKFLDHQAIFESKHNKAFKSDS
ncbi:hypothetical protein CGI74_23485 [Vibrio parahaemolyticus]|uniref:hypothetical protein n=1 Tax=Vibrio parahaemolyticus TaxID=670 RepID=UPI00111CAEC7|nr:hypothetical protein [Vibrio parahaemolyticus]EJG0786317.1 hypothetical protein [Vibrio parahaemolyticus]EJG1593085.1 hypothetical protein [Vibrio parahaemolyticus]TOH74817.1 hypothetical protein CGI74_23485 [Vibrio parahaemolyticus]TOM84800.1 hypothetical protein CGH68_22675 [Vibrio parahaemolyticus]